MAEKLKEIARLDNIRSNITKISELVSGGTRIREYIAKRPILSIFLMILIGFTAAKLSGRIIQLTLKLFSFGLKVAAFVFVARDTYSKVVNIIQGNKKEAVLIAK